MGEMQYRPERCPNLTLYISFDVHNLICLFMPISANSQFGAVLRDLIPQRTSPQYQQEEKTDASLPLSR